MTFFLVTGSIMGASIFLIYKICAFLGLELKWLSLALCAVLAFAVNGAAIAMSPFLDQSHYIRLGVMVLLSAALVTLINELLLRRDHKAAIAAGAGGPDIELAEAEEEPEAAPAPLPVSEPAAETPAEPMTATAAASEAPAEEAVMPMAADTEAGARLSERLHDAMKANVAEYLEEVKALTTLDDLLDYAYAKKASEPDAAVAAYRSAIRLFPDDSYAPFLIIELAGLLKEGARYAEAIDLYSDALSMPIIADDDAMVQEFERTLRYLGTVQDILNKHQASATPFSQIGPELLQEIEDSLAAAPAEQTH